MIKITEEDIHYFALLKTLADYNLMVGLVIDKLSHIGKDYRSIERIFNDLAEKDKELESEIEAKSAECVEMVEQQINKSRAFCLSLSPEEQKLYENYNKACCMVGEKHIEHQIQLPGTIEILISYISNKAMAEYENKPAETDIKIENHIKGCKECRELYRASSKAAEILKKQGEWLND